MNKRRRGIVCIINACTFSVSRMAERVGTDVDRDRLKQLFEQLHFHVRPYNDYDGLAAKVSYSALNYLTHLC